MEHIITTFIIGDFFIFGKNVLYLSLGDVNMNVTVNVTVTTCLGL